jgi:hypothetical protein
MELLWKLLGREYATKCGHFTKEAGRVRLFGEKVTMTLDRGENGSFDYCLRCTATTAIRCPWCGEPILIGDTITLREPWEGYMPSQDLATFGKNPLRLVSCTRRRCTIVDMTSAGYWVLDTKTSRGRVHRVMTDREIYNSGESKGEEPPLDHQLVRV